ncbi:MAG: hypothetical protein K6E66_04470 [Lachnospiraceae bacterium]|nr:hypothetical protein [Lachnospiraceae bacterium]
MDNKKIWIISGAILLIFLILFGIKYYQIENRYDETNGLEFQAVTSVADEQETVVEETADSESVTEQDALEVSDISDDDTADTEEDSDDGVAEKPDDSTDETVAVVPETSQDSTPEEVTVPQAEPVAVPEETAPPDPVEVTPPVTAVPAAVYHFRNANLLNDHFVKHGIEMGFATAEAYEAAASAVITNPNSLYKIEAEDGDGVYYLEATNEFVILSTDGYIRTYFLPSGGKAYFDRQ